MVVGLAVLGAAFALVGRASALQATTQNRVDAHQRGRAGLEAMVTELRSGTCAMTADGTSYPPIVSGDGTKVVFYANTAGPNALPQRRELTYDATAHAIWEDVYQLQSPATDSSGRKGLVRRVAAADAASRTASSSTTSTRATPARRSSPTGATGSSSSTAPPNDTYEATSELAQLPVPITTTDDAQRVVQVRMAIRVRPAGVTTAANSPLDAILVGAAFARSADPVAAANGDTFQLPTLDPAGQPIYVGQPNSCS